MGLVGDPTLLARVLEQYEASLDPQVLWHVDCYTVF
jgi:hypothetical protein